MTEISIAVSKVQDQLLKQQASAVKRCEDELGAVIAQLQIDKAKPVSPCVCDILYYYKEIHNNVIYFAGILERIRLNI